ncbi:MAG: GyrI-like domain-containing protein, partial [Spirochaetia bacterium]|nr:GyrI-like domain-containing protein [Spirochaetia bacterium]
MDWQTKMAETLEYLESHMKGDINIGKAAAAAWKYRLKMLLSPKAWDRIAVPVSTWAKFTSRGPLSKNFQDVIKRIYSEWFPASGREHSDTPELEYYPDLPDTEAHDYWCEYWVPLIKEVAIVRTARSADSGRFLLEQLRQCGNIGFVDHQYKNHHQGRHACHAYPPAQFQEP